MTTKTDPISGVANAVKASWLPMIVIAFALIQMGFNVSALPVSIGGIVEDFNTSPCSVSTALVAYSLAVAGFVMLGAKLGKVIGSRVWFQSGLSLPRYLSHIYPPGYCPANRPGSLPGG